MLAEELNTFLSNSCDNRNFSQIALPPGTLSIPSSLGRRYLHGISEGICPAWQDSPYRCAQLSVRLALRAHAGAEELGAGVNAWVPATQEQLPSHHSLAGEKSWCGDKPSCKYSAAALGHLGEQQHSLSSRETLLCSPLGPSSVTSLGNGVLTRKSACCARQDTLIRTKSKKQVAAQPMAEAAGHSLRSQ